MIRQISFVITYNEIPMLKAAVKDYKTAAVA